MRQVEVAAGDFSFLDAERKVLNPVRHMMARDDTIADRDAIAGMPGQKQSRRFEFEVIHEERDTRQNPDCIGVWLAREKCPLVGKSVGL